MTVEFHSFNKTGLSGMYWSLETRDGIGYLEIDHPNKSVNTLGLEPMKELQDDLTTLENQHLKGLIISSGKEKNFIAGADIEALNEISTRDEAHEASRRGQQVFQRLADLPYPTVALIKGSCLGGGFELALACDYRIAAQTESTKLGCPEVKLGILPGWGGTQRLPRLIGVKEALPRLLKGTTMEPEQARDLGAVDDLGDPSSLTELARRWIENEDFPARSQGGWDNVAPIRWFILRRARQRTLDRTRGNMPAPLSIIETVRDGMGTDLEAGLEIEAANFADLVMTPESKNLIRVFFLREDQKKFCVDGIQPPDPPEDVGVVGGGTMGSGIVHWLSSCGVPTTVIDVDESAIDSSMDRIRVLFEKGVEAGALSEEEVERCRDRITATTDYEALDGRDLIIETVVEDMDVKERVFNRLGNYLEEDTVISSNTSSLSLEAMAQHLPRPGRMVGLHFFNPVYQVPLIEVVQTKSTDQSTLARAVEFVKTIDKVPVVVQDSPGFLVNRILASYMNEAGRLVDEGFAIEDVDSSLEDFGMPVGPLRLLDEVGIDLAFEVATSLNEKLEHGFDLADVFVRIHEDGLAGKKDGEGFYVYGEGEPVPNQSYGPASPKDDPDRREIERRLIDLVVAESVRCLEGGVVETANQLDAALILGIGFAPFRGGPLKHAEDHGLDSVVSELRTFEELYGERFRIPDLLERTAQSGDRLTEDPR